MARSYGYSATSTTTFPFLARPSIAVIHKFRQYPAKLASARISASFPSSKRIVIQRKNHLRPKILKTLTKPLPEPPVAIEPTLPVSIPIIPFQLEPQNDAALDSLNEIDLGTVIEEKKGDYGRISPKFVLKFCGWVIGVYLLQAIVTVWVFGNDSKDKSFGNSESGKGNVFMYSSNAEVVYSDEMEERISEIKAMAREVRKKEGMKRKDGYDDENEIEKEIGDRLIKVEKKLNSKREQFLPDSFMNLLGGFGSQEEDEEEEKEEEENDNDGGGGEMELSNDEQMLLFKKKFGFRSSLMSSSMSSPKGFSGLRSDEKLSSTNGSVLNGKPRDSEIEAVINGYITEKEKEDLHKEAESGAVQENGKARSSNEITEVSKSQNAKKLGSLAKEHRRTVTDIDGPASSSRNPQKRPMANKAGNKQSDVQKPFWWLKLPYVLVILMRKGSELEGQGLYCIKALSQPDDQVESYTVAFEDRGDANNFCHLLDCYFEDLGDFMADIIPLSVKELYEGVKSGSKKVIVVRKGQLKLYVGQPFVEVEMALSSLLEQDQGTP
ncbi:uncharacterized protein LOC126667738 [Mercurialis annua]|uniref:uncharacterized protein LOC126667738 n=1 Tax=Mercurialis annua TaxID=3986 RepID=UPI00215E077B|nr:uncharacterized protein LOC126667738 [Mercurialis annua]